jgi:hypothetical protein
MFARWRGWTMLMVLTGLATTWLRRVIDPLISASDWHGFLSGLFVVVVWPSLMWSLQTLVSHYLLELFSVPRRQVWRWLLLVLVLVLVFSLVLFLLLVFAIVVIIRIVGPLAGFARRQRFAFGGGAFGRFQFAHATMIFPCIEDQMQPRYQLFDRRQLAGRSGFAARTRLALRAGLALGTRFAARALRAGFTLRARPATLALRPRFALWTSLAARTFRAGPAGMALRSGWSLSSLSDNAVFRHVPAPADCKAIPIRPRTLAAIAQSCAAALINVNHGRRTLCH